MEGFLKRNDASKILKIHYHTLEKLGKNNDIEVITIGNTKFYNIKKFLKCQIKFTTACLINLCLTSLHLNYFQSKTSFT